MELLQFPVKRDACQGSFPLSFQLFARGPREPAQNAVQVKGWGRERFAPHGNPTMQRF